MWSPTVRVCADRLVSRRSLSAVHVQRVVSGDGGHMGPAALWRPQTVSSDADSVQRESRSVLARRSMDRLHDQRDWPTQRLRSAISSCRPEISDLAERRTQSALAGRWSRVVLSGCGWDDDGGADRSDGWLRGRVAKDAFSGWGRQRKPALRGDEGWTALPRQPPPAESRHHTAVDRHRQLGLDAPEIARS